LPNANSVDVIRRVRAEMEQIKKELPTGMTGEIAYDATAYINDAISEVVKTLIDTLLIVMVVIFLFLGSFRSVVVPVVAIPISLTGALFREFALTLAGAVFISGVVALTLSPMMSAYLLRAGHAEKGFSGVVNRAFDRFRDWYGSHLDRTLNARPAVYALWGGLTFL